MTENHALADVAALVGEPTRAAILLALLDGKALPAGELATAARLSAAATSLHLGKLTRGGLLVVQQEGRHRYYRLASVEVAHALEALGVIATGRPPPRGRALSPERAALREARTCYDHVAGALGVALAETMERRAVLRADGDRFYEVTSDGARWLADALSLDVSTLSPNRRKPVARRCLDWTERRPHVAGALGAAILERLFAMGWAARKKGSRALRVTTRGATELARLGVVLAALLCLLSTSCKSTPAAGPAGASSAG